LVFSKRIPYYLNNWICELNNNKVSKKLVKDIYNQNFFLSFNYTNTLERIYRIDRNKILHIHGKAPNKKLICGHRDSRLFKQYIQNEDDDVRIVEGENIITEYFTYTYKDKIINFYQDFWNGLEQVNEIHILGHSLSNIDLPYFEMINKKTNANCPKWYFSYYSTEELEHHKKQLLSLGVPNSNINP